MDNGLTRARYDEIREMWNGGLWVKGTSSVPSTNGWRLGLKTHILRFAPQCAFCGECDATEILHIFPAGKGRFGWTPSNVGGGCRDCNDIAAEHVIPFDSILFPAWIPSLWPDRAQCMALGQAVQREREGALMHKARVRGLAL